MLSETNYNQHTAFNDMPVPHMISFVSKFRQFNAILPLRYYSFLRQDPQGFLNLEGLIYQ